MKASAIAIVLCLSINALPQTESLEKQALTLVQRTPASDFNAKLPKVAFMTWLNQQIGPQAGVVWQLTECGEPINSLRDREQDLRACVEVNAGLPNGRKLIITILVGTFKRGITGKPALLHAVVEFNEQLYEFQWLDDLPKILSTSRGLDVTQFAERPSNRSVNLPVINADWLKIRSLPRPNHALPFSADYNRLSADLDMVETPPQPLPSPDPPKSMAETPPRPLPPQDSPKDSEEMLEVKAITRVKPEYPKTANAMNAMGEVKVQVTISEDGRVTEAKAISGHMALRASAVAAAYKWVFRPTTVNGVPTQIKGILTFDFVPGSH